MIFAHSSHFSAPIPYADTLIYCERWEEEAKPASLGVALAPVQKHGPSNHITRVITWESAFLAPCVYISISRPLVSSHISSITSRRLNFLKMAALSPHQLLQQYHGLSTHFTPLDTTPCRQNYFEATYQANSHQSGTYSFDITASSLLSPIQQPYGIIHQPLSCTTTYPNNTMPTNIDVGGYSCTYLGCTRRFFLTRELRQHLLDVHKSYLCYRTNPQTRRPCNNTFSRVYDLRLHEGNHSQIEDSGV
jgi:hypothetical protein